jgi:HSP20 family protein
MWWRRRPFDVWRDFDKEFGFDKEFEEMRRVIDRLMRSLENMPESGKPLVYGFSVEVGPDGVPKVQQFGNVKPGIGGTLYPGVREPYTSTMVDEEQGQLTITAEMPGVSKENIHLNVTENMASIKAEGEEVEYEKELRLSRPIDPDSARASYKNGVLDIVFKLKEPKKVQGKKIDVD